MPKRKADNCPVSTTAKRRSVYYVITDVLLSDSQKEKKLVHTTLGGVFLGKNNDKPLKTAELTGNLEKTLKTNKIM